MPPSRKSNSSHSSSSSSRRSSSGNKYRRSGGGGGNGCVTLLAAVPIVAISLLLFLSGGSTDISKIKEKITNFPQMISNVLDKNSEDNKNQDSNLGNQEDIYVDAIGRTCKWDSEYESYYDKTTDCYFWMNDTIDPPQWQYWYEGISSDYGDYGWMEYDFDEKIWYIEVSDDTWKPLPEKYDTTELWHFSTSG